MAAAHAWVEVFFPGYGWVRFDPDPRRQPLEEFRQSTSNLPAGRAAAHAPAARPGPSPIRPPCSATRRRPRPTRSPVTPPPDGRRRPMRGGLGLPLPLLLAAAAGRCVVARGAHRGHPAAPAASRAGMRTCCIARWPHWRHAWATGHGPTQTAVRVHRDAHGGRAGCARGPPGGGAGQGGGDVRPADRRRGMRWMPLVVSFQRVKRALVGAVRPARRRR